MFIRIISTKTLLSLLMAILLLPLQTFAQEEKNLETKPSQTNTTSANESNSRVKLEDVQRFSNAINQIKKYYVRTTNDKELFDNAIRGMLSGLDPHSSYLDENAFKELQTATNGEFGGLGLEVTIEEGVVKVITPLVDAPAFKAGIKAGDYIIKIGSQSVQGLSLQDAVNLMRGKVGEPIKLTVLRKGEKQPLTFNITRDKILIQSVKSQLLEKKYGYIRITQFQALTSQDMQQAINKLNKEAGGKIKGLILDLRNNPGGLLDSAIQISDAFLSNDKKGKSEIIVYTEGRVPGTKFTAVANPGDILNDAPMIVLINNGSASASEIVAGALQDNKRAIVLGTKSFGKGSVQTVLPLDDKRGIKLTTALYYTPSGKSIQAQGITPDIVVEELSVPKDKQAPNPLAEFSEATLSGHLLNKKENNNQIEQNTKEEENMLHQDYQLYAAFTILKGLAIAQRS